MTLITRYSLLITHNLKRRTPTPFFVHPRKAISAGVKNKIHEEQPKLNYREFSFTLPKGILDAENKIHRQGVIRLSTAKDELAVQFHPQVRENPEYFCFVLWSRVIIRLGTLSVITSELLERLFLVDYEYLQDFYRRINQQQGELYMMGE